MEKRREYRIYLHGILMNDEQILSRLVLDLKAEAIAWKLKCEESQRALIEVQKQLEQAIEKKILS